ncbi:MAG TPA: hypothetical protein VK528_04455 [Flavobacterium sp.]|nr:hypothetical protein [Flavobacterium sp.]
MGQTKSDKEFRNKLDQRKITPSENAWDRLDAMLTVAEGKKPKRSYGWLYIAASFLGFLLIGTVFFSNTEELIDVKRNDVVIENNTPDKPSENTATTDTVIPQAAAENIASADTAEIKIKSSIHHHQSPQSNPISNPVPAVNEIQKNPELIASGNPQRQQSGSAINQKTEQLTTPAKVDELLAAVAPTQNNQNQKTSVKVNAKSLLSQVDGEVNLSFREKMLRTVNRSYQEVAETVSNRNIQQ